MFNKLIKFFVPADHTTTVDTIGASGLLRMIVKSGFASTRTMRYLLKNKRYNDLFNFFYTKIMVPTGEGSGELAYYFIGPLLRKNPFLAPFPRFIEVEVSTLCNKKCIICEHTWWGEDSRVLTFNDFKALVDQFPLRWINLTGEGDAFLNKDYIKMIKYLKDKGTSVYLVDSFDLINKEISLELIKLGVDGIYISIDGATKETYEKIKVGCNFDNVVNNIRNFLEIKNKFSSPIPEICFRFVVNKLNVHEMSDFVKLIRSIGAKKQWGDTSRIHFVGLLNYPEVSSLYLEKIPINYIEETLSIVRDDNETLPVIFAHTESYKNPSMNKCLAWMEPYFALVPDNMVLPCCAVLMSNSRKFLQEYSFGNYTKESLKLIWNHDYYKWFRNTVTKHDAPVPALCKGCRAYNTTDREKNYGIDNRKRIDFE